MYILIIKNTRQKTCLKYIQELSQYESGDIRKGSINIMNKRIDMQLCEKFRNYTLKHSTC